MRGSPTYALTACAPNTTASSRPRKNSSTASWIVARGSCSRMANSLKVRVPALSMDQIILLSRGSSKIPILGGNDTDSLAGVHRQVLILKPSYGDEEQRRTIFTTSGKARHDLL